MRLEPYGKYILVEVMKNYTLSVNMENKLIAIVAIGGAIGSVLRYILPFIIPGDNTILSTLSINLLGSLLLGILFGLLASGLDLSEELVLLLGTGILGSFTTMSTFAFQALEATQINYISGLSYILITIMGSIFLSWLGYSVMIQISS